MSMTSEEFDLREARQWLRVCRGAAWIMSHSGIAPRQRQVSMETLRFLKRQHAIRIGANGVPHPVRRREV